MTKPTMRVQTPKNEWLPVELLTEIFLYLEDESGIRSVLCVVCKMWRMVTISVPSLWSTIWLVPPSTNIPASEFVPRLELLGKRSGRTPLHIKWNLVKDFDLDDAYKPLLQCMTQLIPISRWRSLDILEGSYASESIVTLAETCTCNNLQRLGVFTGGRWVHHIFQLLKVAHARPTILNLAIKDPVYLPEELEEIFLSVKELEGSHVHLSILPYTPYLETITAVSLISCWRTPSNPYLRHIQSHSISIYHLIMIDCPYLETLEVSCLVVEYPGEAKLPRLRTLRVNSAEFSPLYLLRLPQLETLHISAPESVPKTVDSCMAGNLEEPQYSLTPTVLNLYIRISIPIINWTLRRSPKTEFLRLLVHKKAGNINELINALAQPSKTSSSRQQTDSAPQYVCPSLRTMHFDLDWEKAGPATTPLMKHSRQYWVQRASKLLKARSETLLEEITIQWQDGDSIHLTRQTV
ncbi:hypothetical protein CPB86DRAFT_790367 [Serendipita vermifera]|nr:hypothetical protein CPB86DRAFT_790367 [Serendipita vermifera]